MLKTIKYHIDTGVLLEKKYCSGYIQGILQVRKFGHSARTQIETDFNVRTSLQIGCVQ